MLCNYVVIIMHALVCTQTLDFDGTSVHGQDAQSCNMQLNNHCMPVAILS